jgi:hypothetical protein
VLCRGAIVGTFVVDRLTERVAELAGTHELPIGIEITLVLQHRELHPLPVHARIVRRGSDASHFELALHRITLAPQRLLAFADLVSRTSESLIKANHY